MPDYRVRWEIDMEDVDNPEEAAARALIVMRDNDPANTATCFEVTPKNADGCLMFGETKFIDLSKDSDE